MNEQERLTMGSNPGVVASEASNASPQAVAAAQSVDDWTTLEQPHSPIRLRET